MEADVLRWSLLIIGSLVIVGLAVHGIWLSRKNADKEANDNNPQNDQEYQPCGWQSDADNFDEVLNGSNKGTGEDLNIKFDIDDVGSDIAHSKSTENDYDNLGLGAVRVVSNEPNLDVAGKPPLSTDTHSTDTLSTDIHSTDTHSTDTHSTDIHSTDTQAEPDPPTSKIYASVVTQPKPEYAAKYATLAEEPVVLSKQEKTKSSNSSESHKVDTPLFTEASNHSFSSNASHQIPEPPPFLLKKDIPETGDAATTGFATEERTKINTPAAKQTGPEQKPSVNLSEKLSMSEQARNLVKRKKADAVAKRREPKISEEQMRIDFDEQPTAVPETKEELKAKPDGSEQQQEVLVLNVKSADNNPIPGAGLLPMLLTLGFKFGDQDIFHRHVNSNGKGPVLFSLANMFKPGNFDIDSLETFSTQGISLFMILPIEGEPHQVFNMMHNAARKIADEFSAQIYDGRRTLLTKQSLQQYVEKIREFERQRLLRG